MKKTTYAYIGIASALALTLGVIIITIWKTDPYAETMEAACYPDHVKTWHKQQPGNHLFVTCMDPDGVVTREVEVKHKPGK